MSWHQEWKPPELVTAGDLTAALAVLRASDLPEECGVARGHIAEFLHRSRDEWQYSGQELGIIWGVALGVLAERHRIVRQRP